MKGKLLLAAAVTTAAALVPAGSALAAGVNDPGYGTPGSTTAQDNTICAGHGAFGAFGNFGDVTHDFGINNLGTNGRPGASSFQFPGAGGGTTGGNNSALCGNQATPPPFTP